MKKWLQYCILLIIVTTPMNVFGMYGDVNIHGFISQGYLWSDQYNYFYAETADGTFQFNEMGINFTSQLANNLRLGLQFFAKDLGEFGNDEITIDWAYADYRFSNEIGIKVGKIKRAFGIFNEIRDVDIGRMVVFPPDGVYVETLRDQLLASKGLGIYGMLPGGFEYQVVYGEIPQSIEGGAAKMVSGLSGKPLSSVKTEPTPSIHVRWNTPVPAGMSVGFSAYQFDTLNIAADSTGTIFDGSNFIVFLQYFIGNMMLAGEYNWVDIDSKFGQEVAPGIIIPIELEIKPDAWYGMVTYQLTAWFGIGLTYSESYVDRNDKSGKEAAADPFNPAQYKEQGFMKDFTLSTRFDINDSWVLKLEAHHMEGLNGAELEDEKYEGAVSHLIAVKISYAF